MIDRIVLPVCLAVVIGWMLYGCSDADFTVAQPLSIAPTDDAVADTEAIDDAAPIADALTESVDDAVATPDAAPDAAPDAVPDAAPDTDIGSPDGAIDAAADVLVSTPGTVACTSKPAGACAAFACDESADCSGARCCLRPDGAGSTCDCSGASMDAWTVLCLTEGDCYGGRHCTPWAAWDHHGRCL